VEHTVNAEYGKRLDLEIDMTPHEDDTVTVGQCKERFNSLKWTIRIIMAVIVVSCCLAGYAALSQGVIFERQANTTLQLSRMERMLERQINVLNEMQARLIRLESRKD